MDDMQADDGAEKRAAVPTFRYRRDLTADGGYEKRLFEHPDDVPPNEGWVDSPALVDAEPVAPPDSVGLEAPYEEHGFHKLRLELQRRTGKGTRPGTTKKDLIKTLEALDR